MLKDGKCFSHACCTPYQVKRKTKSACVSKVSMPCFNSRNRKKKLVRMNRGNSEPAVPPCNSKRLFTGKFRKNSAEAIEVAASPPESYLGVNNHVSSYIRELSSPYCRKRLSLSRSLQYASTQTSEIPSVKKYCFSSRYADPSSESVQEEFHAESKLKIQDIGGATPIRARKGKMGNQPTCRYNSLGIINFPVIDINPSDFRNETSNIGDSHNNDRRQDSLEEIEEGSLIGFIHRAQEKVDHIRARLGKLSQTLTSQTKIQNSRDTKPAKKLKKVIDDMIEEMDAVSEIGRNWVTSPSTKMPNSCGDSPRKSHFHTSKSKVKAETPKKTYSSSESQKKFLKPNKNSSFPRQTSVESSSSIGKESSLTLLKKELGYFFDKMKLETDLLMEDGKMHRKTLHRYSGACNSISTFEASSTDSSGL